MAVYRLILDGVFIGYTIATNAMRGDLIAVKNRDYRAIRREHNALHVKEHRLW